MKSALVIALSLSLSSVAFAASPAMPTTIPAKAYAAAKKAGKEMIKNDVRTVVVEVENIDGNPCMPEGKSLQVQLQVKMARAFDMEKMETVYEWETVKTLGVDNDGGVMEICAE